MKNLLNLIILFLLFSCGNSIEFKEDPIPKSRQTVPINTINFSEVSEKIFKPSCIKCHAGYVDYETVSNEKDKILESVISGRMPKNAGPLDQDLKALLSAWVNAGAPIGGGIEPPPKTELEPNWDSLSKLVFFPKCVQCHNPDGQASLLDLSSRDKFFEAREYLFNNFVDVESSYFVEVLNDTEEPMPPTYSDIERLSEKEIKTIIEWVKKGLLL